MSEFVTKERLYHTTDRKAVVTEGDPRAAVLLAGEGAVLAEAEVKRLHLEAHVAPAPAPDPRAEAQAKLDDAVARGALDEALAHKHALDRLTLAAEAPAAEKPARRAAAEKP
jgi:hypothetical protein